MHIKQLFSFREEDACNMLLQPLWPGFVGFPAYISFRYCCALLGGSGWSTWAGSDLLLLYALYASCQIFFLLDSSWVFIHFFCILVNSSYVAPNHPRCLKEMLCSFTEVLSCPLVFGHIVQMSWREAMNYQVSERIALQLHRGHQLSTCYLPYSPNVQERSHANVSFLEKSPNILHIKLSTP